MELPTIKGGYPKPSLSISIVGWVLFVASCYLILITTVYLARTWKHNRQRKENVICCLTSLSPFANAFWIALFTTGALPESFNFCLTFLMNNYTTLCFSKVLTNIVFALRYKSLNKKYYCTSILITVVIAMIVCGHQVYIYVFFFHFRRDLCTEEFTFKDDHALFISSVVVALVNFVLQTATIVGVILPIQTHCNNLSCGLQQAGQRKSVKGVLKRVVICSSIFTLGEMVFIAIAIFSSTDFIAVFVTSDLIVNTFSLVFSFSDYRARAFPFARDFSAEKKKDCFTRIVKDARSRISLRVVETQPQVEDS